MASIWNSCSTGKVCSANQANRRPTVKFPLNSSTMKFVVLVEPATGWNCQNEFDSTFAVFHSCIQPSFIVCSCSFLDCTFHSSTTCWKFIIWFHFSSLSISIQLMIAIFFSPSFHLLLSLHSPSFHFVPYFSSRLCVFSAGFFPVAAIVLPFNISIFQNRKSDT